MWGNDAMKAREDLFLGLDSSTQSLTAVLVDSNLNILSEESLVFERDLPEFKTVGGVHRHDDGKTVTSPAIMWVAALDMLLDRMKSNDWPLANVAAISGSGQQHGSVWLNADAHGALAGLEYSKPLRCQLEDVFTIADSPIWLDSSTTGQCLERERVLGGAQAVADLTGSRAYERFTGNQIARIWQSSPDAYEATNRIALVSSFMASLFAGAHVPIDVSDASGMNLMDLRRRKWSKAALDCTAPDLAAKVGEPVPSHTVFGPLHPYYGRRFGFNEECRLVVFSGDNPNSLAGLMLMNPGDLAVSLGTSDTLFGSLSEPTPSATEGHVLASPIDPEAYMALMCWKNGSLTRESIRDRLAHASWDRFDELLRSSTPGNDGSIGFYFSEQEITPQVSNPGIFRFAPSGKSVPDFDPKTEVRAIVEGKFLSMRIHGMNIGLKPQKILATGGASANENILRIMADVFGVRVGVGDRPGSAALGAAYRAIHGLACERNGCFLSFSEVLDKAPPLARSIEPDRHAHAVYSGMLSSYADLERRICGE